jgi:hypothetical protein
MNQALSLSLLDVAKLTWPRVPNKGSATFAEYCKFLYDQKEDIWTICSENGSELEGMIAAKNTAGVLYVTMFVTLKPGCFEKFISLLEEIFGPITTLKYMRRMTPKTVDFARFKNKIL